MKQTRIVIVAAVFSLLFLSIVIRLFYWQVVNGEELSSLAEKQHFTTMEIPAYRGSIFASDRTPLVTNDMAYLLYADLRNIKDNPKKLAKELAPILISETATSSGDIEAYKEEIKKQEEDILYKSLSNPEAVWVPLAHRVSPKLRQSIDNLKFLGLGFEDELLRFYPEGSSSAHILGFVGKDRLGQDKGYFGLEGKYDLELKGKQGKLRAEKDALGRPILFGQQDMVKTEEGRTLVTTIDKYIQMQSEKYLKEGLEQWGAVAGNVIVMDPQSGAVLAMASYPSYDPAHYGQYPESNYKNPGVSDVFEPGSIMKPIIMSIALEKNKLNPQTRCPSPKCDGPREIGGYVIKTYNDQYHPNLTMTEVLENSDNTGMVFVGELLGKKTIYDYLSKYEFGKATGIDLEAEEDGVVKSINDWYPIDSATVTFGQGIAVTPIQMVRAFSVIANGGNLIKPYLVKTIIDNGKEIDVTPHEKKRILKTETTKVLTEMLVNVNNKSALHFPMERIPHLNEYRIAAKSGTAQIPIAGHYDPTKTVGSVIGFVPADNPKFLVMVRLIAPSVRIWGSDTSGPIFYNIVNDLLSYYGIPPGH